MSVVKMSKISIIGLKQDYAGIMEILTRSHCFEVASFKQKINGSDRLNEDKANDYAVLRAKAAFAIDYILGENDRYMSLKVKPFESIEPLKKESVRPIISADELYNIESKRDELMQLITVIDAISHEQNDIRHNIQKIKEEADAYRVYINFDGKFSDIRDTRRTFSALFAGSLSVTPPVFESNVYYKEYKADIKKSVKNNLLFVTGLNEDKERILSAINEKGYSSCAFNSDVTAGEAIEGLEIKQIELSKRSDELFKQALDLREQLSLLKTLYDYCTIMTENYSSAHDSTGYITVIEGWCPSDWVQKIQAQLSNRLECVYFDVNEPDGEDVPPTLLKNSSAVQPFEDLTAMYTTPDYRDRDPNILMGIWFFFLFGIMAGDVVYGIMISLTCFLFMRFKKMEQGMFRLVKLFFYCGFSSIIWGFIFGSFLGYSIPVSNFPLSYIDSEGARYLGWFNPMESPMMLLGLSLLVGMIHLLFAFGVKFVYLVKDKKPVSALLDSGLNMLTIVSILLIAANIFAGIFTTGQLDLGAKVLPENISSTISSIGMIMLVSSIVAIFLLSGRESLLKRKFGGWLGAGVNGLYNGLIGLMSDILSYSRLFGLGLAGGAIAFAFNLLVDSMFFSGAIPMKVIGAIVLIVLHVFNLAISLLGTYVHNARLQFLEFYGKFLTGNGKPFEPLGENTKYVRIK